MADPVTTIQTAAATVDATHALLTSVISILPTIAYAITAAAAYMPKPADDAPSALKLAYKVVNAIAFNIKHARNIADDRRKEHRDENAPTTEPTTEQADAH